MLEKSQLITLTLVIICSILVASRSYNNGLIFYDLKTTLPYLPPTVSVSRGRALANVKFSEKGSIWSTFGKPCECSGMVCGCCAGIKVKQYKFDQKMCANITYVTRKEEAQLDVFLNEKPSAKYAISVRNPSPFCIPVMMGIPMAMCVQMSDIGLEGNNLNMCMDFIVRLATTDLFEMHFQCMRMGLDGVQYLDKDGQPVIPPSASKTETTEAEEYYDETAPADNEIDAHAEEEEEAENSENAVEDEQTNDEYNESENVHDNELEAEKETSAEKMQLQQQKPEMTIERESEKSTTSTADVAATTSAMEALATTATPTTTTEMASNEAANEIIDAITTISTTTTTTTTTTASAIETNVEENVDMHNSNGANDAAIAADATTTESTTTQTNASNDSNNSIGDNGTDYVDNDAVDGTDSNTDTDTDDNETYYESTEAADIMDVDNVDVDAVTESAENEKVYDVASEEEFATTSASAEATTRLNEDATAVTAETGAVNAFDGGSTQSSMEAMVVAPAADVKARRQWRLHW